MDYLQYGREVIMAERKGLELLSLALGNEFCSLCEEIIRTCGKVVVSGVGKAGLIGRKISATLASTGTPSIWLDPINALHGDLGMVGVQDIAILISNSGSSSEILACATALKSLKVKTVALTKNKNTPLAIMCDLAVPLGEHSEAGSLNFVPSTSTTVMLVLGDSIALSVQHARGFTESDYARYHPAGALGRRLMQVGMMMRKGIAFAKVKDTSTVLEAIEAITHARSGLCVVVDDCNCLSGVYTDGDFRRDVMSGIDIKTRSVESCMTKPGRYVNQRIMVAEAVDLMMENHINVMPVVDDARVVVGVLDVQDVI
jgi:arabinose-5-phosphate isomerase